MSHALCHGWRCALVCFKLACASRRRTLCATQDHVDYLSVQAMLFEEKGLSIYQQTRLLFVYRKRISDA